MAKDTRRNHVEAIPFGSDNESSASNDVFDEEKAYKAMAELFCHAGLPPSTAKHELFRRLLNPAFSINYDTVVHHCMEVEKANKTKMKNVLKSLDGKFGLSMELMRPDPSNKGCGLEYTYADEPIDCCDYLCVKAHFISEDWKLKSFTLGYFCTLDVEDETDPENIVMKLLTDWEIEDKVSTITSQTDSICLDESVMAIKDKLQFRLSSMPLDGRFFHVSCCADVLSSVSVKAFSRIERAISAIRAYSSWRRAPLYWENTLDMLQEAHKLEAEGCYEEDDPPTAKEWEQIRRVCKLVQKVYDAAEIFFETNYATGGVYFHNLQELRVSLIEESKSSDQFTKKIAERMLKKLNKYWERDSLILAIVTTLDPRYKMKYFKFSSFKYGVASGISDIKTISDAIHKLYDDYASCVTEKEYTVMSESNSESEEEEFLRAEVKERHSHPAFGFKCLDEYQQFVQSRPSSRSSTTIWKRSLLCPGTTILVWCPGGGMPAPNIQLCRKWVAIFYRSSFLSSLALGHTAPWSVSLIRSWISWRWL